MCLTVKSGPHITKKSFFTLKIVDYANLKSCKGYYYPIVYKYGEEKRSRICKNYFNDRKIEQGLHSIYNNLFTKRSIGKLEFSAMGIGIVLCEVPKGAKYYIGTDGDIVSNRIIVRELLVSSRSYLKEKVKINKVSTAVRLAFKIAKSYKYNLKPS